MRTPGPSIYDFAPRLALAMDQRREEIRVARRALVRLAGEKSDCERLVAHRELQELRAGAIGDRRYLERRARKLEAARKREQRVTRAIEYWTSVLSEAA